MKIKRRVGGEKNLPRGNGVFGGRENSGRGKFLRARGKRKKGDQKTIASGKKVNK